MDGFSATAGRAPVARMACSVRWRCGDTSAWTEMMLAPAFANAST